MQAGECRIFWIRKNKKNGRKRNMKSWYAAYVIGHFIHLNNSTVVGSESVTSVHL
jgi:hypothetical protein